MNIFFSPHADDETLFGAFTLIKHKPLVVICYPSERDYGYTEVRLRESKAAVELLGAGPVEQWYGADGLEERMRAVDTFLRPAIVWAPHPNTSHPDHHHVGETAARVFGSRVRRYHTYVGAERVREGAAVPFAPGDIELKLRALACYRTQITHPRACQFFLQDQVEFMEAL